MKTIITRSPHNRRASAWKCGGRIVALLLVAPLLLPSSPQIVSGDPVSLPHAGVTTLFTSQALATPEAEAFRADPTPKLWSKQGAAVLSRGALQPTVHGQSAAVREERRIASMIVRQSSEEKSSQHKPSLREESLELFVRGWSYEEIAEKLNAT